MAQYDRQLIAAASIIGADTPAANLVIDGTNAGLARINFNKLLGGDVELVELTPETAQQFSIHYPNHVPSPQFVHVQALEIGSTATSRKSSVKQHLPLDSTARQTGHTSFGGQIILACPASVPSGLLQ